MAEDVRKSDGAHARKQGTAATAHQDSTIPPHRGDGSGGRIEDSRHAGEEVGAFADNMRERARDIADEKKDMGAEKIDDVADAVHKAADAVAPHMQGAANYIHEAAQNLTRMSSALRERSIDEVLSDVNRFARAQPAAFFGASLLAGLALTRFLKSSAPADAPRQATMPGQAGQDGATS